MCSYYLRLVAGPRPHILNLEAPLGLKGKPFNREASLLVSAGAHPESTGREQCLCVPGFPSVRENSSIEWQFPAFVPGPEGVTHAEVQQEMASEPLPTPSS